jgi:hypothetical protein
MEGTQKITTYYTPVVMTPERSPEYNPKQDVMDQRVDARRNL